MVNGEWWMVDVDEDAELCNSVTLKLRNSLRFGRVRGGRGRRRRR